MSLIEMNDYPPRARAYWYAVTAAGAVALLYTFAQLAAMPGQVLLQVLLCSAVAAIVGLFPVRIPGAKTAVAGAEIFIFLTLMLFGPPAAVLAAALEGFVAAAPSAGRAVWSLPRWRPSR